MKIKKSIIYIVLLILISLTIQAFNVKAATKTRIAYTTHVQYIGWQDYVSNGAMAGTSGKSLRLEGIKIKLENQEYDGNVLYRTHIQNLGWETSFKKNDEMSGTSGRSFRLEAIEIKLDGGMKEYYDVYYRVHAENFGWLGWAKNGESAGTAGYSFRLEGIEIKLVSKGESFPEYGQKVAFKDKNNSGKNKLISYTTHVQNIGWQDYVSDGAMAGTSGRSLRLEGIKIKLENQKYDGNVLYRTHIENLGWEKSFKKNNKLSGTSGKSLRLEAIEIKLDGGMKDYYDIYYRVHAQNFGWLGWARNGESAGTAGYAYRLEGIEIKLVKKGKSFPEYGKQEAFKDKYAVTSITLDQTKITIDKDKTYKLNATITPSNATDQRITWTSSDESVATVAESGRVRGIGKGTATIKATTSNGKKATCKVTVEERLIINNLVAESDNVQDAINNTTKINEALTYANNNGIEKVVLKKGNYYLYIDHDSNIFLQSNIDFDLNDSAIRMVATDATLYYVLNINSVQNVKIHDGRIIGDRNNHDYSKEPDSTHEWGMGIRIGNSSNVDIENVKITKTTGDGIYITDNMKTGEVSTKNINILNNEIYNCRRNGITIVSGDHINIQYNDIHSISGTPPQVAIDIERNKEYQFITNTTISNNRMYDNARQISFIAYKGTSNLTFTNNELGDPIAARYLSYCYWENGQEIFMTQEQIMNKYNYNISGNKVITGIDSSLIRVTKQTVNKFTFFRNPIEVEADMHCDENSLR